MNDETKKDMFNFILSKVGAENIGQVVFEQNNTIYVSEKRHSQMPALLSSFLLRGSIEEQAFLSLTILGHYDLVDFHTQE